MLILASDVGGIGEIIRHQGTGMLARSGDVNHFVEVTQTLLASAERRSQLQINATEHVHNSFSLANLLHHNDQMHQNLMLL